jgi:dTMP kinase
MPPPRACLITLEGGEGAGKSTQVGRLAAALSATGLAVVTTREPGGAPGAEDIRALLVDGEPGRWDPLSEALLHFAARREHLRHFILPALERGSWVISDRFADSTMAYQGHGLGLDRAFIETLYENVAGDLRPDLTLILDLPVEEGLARALARAGGGMRYERMGLDFHRRLREGFLDIARREPARCVVVDAARNVDRVADDVIAAVRENLAPPGL